MFLFPSKPIQIFNPDTLLESMDGWIMQFKKNGCRAIVSGENDKVTVYNREGTTLSVSKEYDWSPLLKMFPQPFLLDGELIGRKQGETSNRLYLWDMPICDGRNLTKESYMGRYAEMIRLFPAWQINDPYQFVVYEAGIVVGIANCLDPASWSELFKFLSSSKTGENEGFVFKNPKSTMDWSRTSTKEIPNQMKFLFKYYKR